jgi:hypothetical protein
MNVMALTGREAHPVLPMPPVEDGSVADQGALAEFYALRREALMLERIDPLRHGYEASVWGLADRHRAELRALYPAGVIHEVNLGGARAGKSERAAKRVVEACLGKPGSVWWCCDSTEAQSRANGQRLIWKYLPREWRNDLTGKLRRTKTTKVVYSNAGGFSENNVFLPNESAIFFKFYAMDVDDLEGAELDGIWADELIPLEWIEELGYRLVTRNGLWHVTFTPKAGYTPTVAHYLDDAKTIDEVEANLLPQKDERGAVVGYQRVPRVQYCKDEKARVIYFHTEDNPYGNYPGMVEEVRHTIDQCTVPDV